MQYIRVDLEADGDRLLQPGDRLNVYDNTLYTNIGEVRVSGAVKEPFGTTYDESLTLHDMLCMAGGFTVGAAYDRVEVFRLNISKTNEVDLDLITLQVDENYNLIGRTFDLQPYDHIVVRMTPNYTTGRYIELNGRVKYPGVYVLEDTKTQLWDIIKKAGGLLDDADPYARLTRTQGRNTGSIGLNLTKAKRNKNSMKNDPILMEGDVINIVRQENTVVIRETGTRMAQYVPAEYSSTQKVLVYDGAHRAKWYIKHYAGGFTKTADKNSVTVTMPNNQSECTRRFLGIRRYPKVQPGGVITLRIDDKKKERIEKPKEKVDWGVEARNSLAALVSIVSIILLLNNLNK
jgi:protein involved in polysaccharide export with SLBB domain